MILIVSLWVHTAFASIQIHVSPTGRDDQPGSIQAPVATLAHALELVRSIRTTTNLQPVVITLQGGIYFGSNEVDLSAADSGTEEAPLRIESVAGETAIFHGGIRLNPNVLQRVTAPVVLQRIPAAARTKIWCVNLRALGINDFGVMKQHGFGTPVSPAEMELFVDGQPWHLARYPNARILKIGRIIDRGSVPRDGDRSNRGATFGYEYERAGHWAGIPDVWLRGRFNNGFADDNLSVADINPLAHTIHLAQPHLYGVKSSIYPETPTNQNLGEGAGVRGYYAYNLLEELDAPEEYYLDRQTGILYLYGENRPAHATIDLSLRTEPFLVLQGVHDVTISGIDFVCSRGMGIYEEDTERVTIKDCVFRNLGTVAVSMGESLMGATTARNSDGSPTLDATASANFKDDVIIDCQIGNNGAGGVIVAGGDRRTLKPGENRVSNCEFFGNSRRNETYSPSVKLRGVGNTVRECYFHDQRHQSIGYQGNNFVIERNIFARDCQDSDDMGVIYTGRDPSARGTIIRNNFFTDILPPNQETKMCAIYVDDGSGGITISRNIFCRAGNPGPSELFGAVFFNGGHDNIVAENVFIECPLAVGAKAWPTDRWRQFLAGTLMQQRLKQDVNIASATYLKAYPELADYFADSRPRLNRILGNAFFKTQLAMYGDYSLKANYPLPGITMEPVSSWTPSLVAMHFQTAPLVKSILAESIGLNHLDRLHWSVAGQDKE